MNFNEERHPMATPNLYRFATKELAQDATIAYILEWADPEHRKSYPRLHALGIKLLRSLLRTQKVDLPLIKTLYIRTQVVIKPHRDRIDILVQINTDQNTDRIILIIEDKVGITEHSNQIKRYKEIVKEKYSGRYDHLVAVYLKTGNESREYLPPKKKCGSFMRRDLLDVLDGFQDTKNTIVEDFRRHLQKLEDDANRKRDSFVSRARTLGVYDLFVAVEEMFKENWPSSTQIIYRDQAGLYFKLLWNKTRKPIKYAQIDSSGKIEYARIDLSKKVIQIVFFPDAISLCVDEFKPLIKEIPFKTWRPSSKTDALTDLDAALKDYLEIQFQLTEADWEIYKEKLNRLTRAVYEAQQSRIQSN